MKTYKKRVIIGGCLATLITSVGMLVLDHISGLEAKELIKSSLPRMNTFFNTIVLASGTILTLLLTITNISYGSQTTLKKDFYHRFIHVAKLDALVFIISVITFLLINNPLTQADNIHIKVYTYLYYSLSIISSLVCGAIVAVIIMLYEAITTLIKIIGLGVEDHPLINQENSSSSENKPS
ncbi:hypothetical protein SAMN04488096_10424 [Mesonia phycicola]|uniref:Uncharacterized protein n=1 Tax=Mesonia phycicola TaxID=579105 RepID=A0A1M6DIM8_9FLAO|nr:hypothetical protein [Mesonia phycicola]SHI73207.1 hypothetical protein SAMN04488096_10424 [Mesonia phycicola]